MSKEVIKSSQFAQVRTLPEDIVTLTPEQKVDLAALYEGISGKFKPGKLITGQVLSATTDGVLVDIGYKSNGLIHRFEFTDFELKKLQIGDEIEVILDELEDVSGNLVLSYEKAKALRAWDQINTFFKENRPVEGIVTHKVKGGLSVDIGIPAFLPGSQVDVQRVNDFDHYVGQTITAYIIKLNQKRGNVIISRRKFLNEQRQESRKKILEGLSEGQVIQGMVKNITNYGVFVDIGGVDGLLHITDMTWGRIAHPSELVKIGDKITVKVLSFDKDHEKISLGMKQLAENPWEQMNTELVPGARIKGRISSITDYGLFIEISKGVEGLVHISEISWTERVNNLHKYFKVGQDIEVYVVSVDKNNRRMSLSIKQLQDNPWKSIAQKFHEHQLIKGKISNITDFGIFVQLLPGIDGLVHISDLSWTEHITHPNDIYKIGDEVEAIVISIDEENKRISLGIKQLQQNPWDLIEKEYPIGTIVDGEVSKITNFGAFVKLPIGIEGLVHISELSESNVDRVEDVLRVGQKYPFRVIKVTKDERKLGLSLKLTDEPKKPKRESKPQATTTATEKKRENTNSGSTPNKFEQQSSAQPRQKSLLQLELEKHAARQRDEDNE